MRGQNGLRNRIEREVAAKFPGLPPAELARRADAAYRAHFTRMSFRSAKARGAKATVGEPKTRQGGGGPRCGLKTSEAAPARAAPTPTRPQPA
jgi:hypothetical protein